MNKNAASKLKCVRLRTRIKRWLVAATLLLIIASILLVDIGYIFM